MNRLVRILLLAALLGPSIGHILRPFQEVCAETRQDCCGPDGRCHENCVECACCAARPVTFQCPASVENLDGRPAPPTGATATTPPSAPPSDILHIPKSA